MTPVMYSDSTGNYPVRILMNSTLRFFSPVISGFNRIRSQLMAFDYKANHRNPNRGIPGSTGRIFYPDGRPKQERVYGPDGRPIVDHDHHHGEDVGYDHDHDWDWNNKENPRGPARTPDVAKIAGKAVAATVTIVGGYYLIKWGIAIILAPSTGGGSLIIAGVMP